MQLPEPILDEYSIRRHKEGTGGKMRKKGGTNYEWLLGKGLKSRFDRG